jgi:glycosyltransferase involved in cell wall biosynthesis
LPTDANAKQAEQFGKAALEGVLCGLPVLVSDSGQLPRWSQELGSVRRLPAWIPEAVAKTVQDLWSSPPSAPALLASRERVWEHYGSESVGQRMEKAFMDLLKDGTR